MDGRGEPISWLSTKEAAERLGVTLRSLYRFIDEGGLAAYKFGRVIRLKESDVETSSSRAGSRRAASSTSTPRSRARPGWSTAWSWGRWPPRAEPAHGRFVTAFRRRARMSAMADCLFCSIVAGDVPADDRLPRRADGRLPRHHPQAPTHVLVVPTRHIVNAGTVVAEDADDVVALLVAAKAVADAEGIGGQDRGYRLVFNVGPDASNSVAHLHLHVLGRTDPRLVPGLSTARRASPPARSTGVVRAHPARW